MTRSSDLIDWDLAARVGGRVGGSGPSTTAGFRRQAREDFIEFTRLSDRLVRDFTGLSPAVESIDPIVLSRGAWIRANLDGFSELLAPVTERLAAAAGPSAVTRRLTRAAVGLQIGLLLGYLSQKVLGQYDLVLTTEGAGKVYYVGPNIVEAEQRLALAPRDFRLWIALHEVTHRTQFTAVPWLRARVKGLVERSFAAMDLDSARMRRLVERGKELLLSGPQGWRAANVMNLLLSDEQRGVLAEMQALMCIVEGHGTFVMNRLGESQIPSYAHMKGALEARRRSTSSPERVFQRAIGLDMKYEQYVLGEKFCNEVADRAGTSAVNRVWEADGDNMPSLEEMRDPEAWLVRTGA
ncbi:MAG: zinc-dependent metalloprotease [Actinomycetota bacterium]